MVTALGKVHQQSHFLFLVLSLSLLCSFNISPANGSHSWDPFRWPQTTNVLTISIQNCHTTSQSSQNVDWDNLLTNVVYYWNNVPSSQDLTASNLEYYSSDNVDIVLLDQCNGNGIGGIQTYNGNYGTTDWLGIAQLYTYQGTNDVARVLIYINEYYIDLNGYTRFNNEVAWQQVLCHEIGHGLTLGHQSESGADLDTCLDYSTVLNNRYPNQHDVEELDSMYATADDTTDDDNTNDDTTNDNTNDTGNDTNDDTDDDGNNNGGGRGGRGRGGRGGRGGLRARSLLARMVGGQGQGGGGRRFGRRSEWGNDFGEECGNRTYNKTDGNFAVITQIFEA